jgi:hypothetical protein
MLNRANRNWNFKEISYLKNSWGNVSLKSIAKHLGRTITGVQIKANRIGLKRSTDYGEYITFYQFLKIINKDSYRMYNKRLKQAGFPFKKIHVITKKITVIYMDEFWRWLEKNKHLIDLQYTEFGDFGYEPEWVYYKRDADKRASKYEPRKWSNADDERLISLLKQFKYGYRDLSIMLKRTEGAIKRRMSDLNIKERPLVADTKKWTQQEIDLVKDLYLKGYKSQIIAEYVDRSACSINGIIERYNYFKS